MKREAVEASSTSARRDEILDAAAETFMNVGFGGASVDAISRAVGATKGIVYHHFASKSELFFAVNRRSMEMTRAALLTSEGTNEFPPDRLFAMAMAHSLLIMEHLPYLRVAALGLETHLAGRTTAQERAELGELIELRDANEHIYVDVLEAGVRNASFRNLQPRQTVKPLLGSLNWTSRWYQPRPDETRAEREQLARQIAAYAVRGVVQIGSLWSPA